MEDDRIFDLTEYRRGTGNLVPCPRCSRPIPASATRCPECRVHFQGQAYEFAEAKAGPLDSGRPVIRVAAWVLLIALALIAVAFVVGALLG